MRLTKNTFRLTINGYINIAGCIALTIGEKIERGLSTLSVLMERAALYL